MVCEHEYMNNMSEMVTSHILQVQVKSQVIYFKLKSSPSHFRRVASQVKSRVIWLSSSQIQVTQYKPIDY